MSRATASAPQPLLDRVLEPGAAADDDPTTESILDAALEQFELFGLRRSTVDDVARRSGVARVTIYRRFGQKDRLIEAVMLRELRRFLAELDAAVTPLESVEQRMVEGFVVTLRFARRHSLVARLLTAEPETLLPYLTLRGGPLLAIARGFLAERIRQAQDEGDVGDLDPEQAAEVVVRLMLSFILTPESCVPLNDVRQMRAFARRYVAPLVTRSEPSE
ncbi:MAG TPA: TetR family transcriptional regulator [Solirubrobacteraceae bacterium]|nr:TetR family transcriptional regulator [Solirubrobacteraceae bacterium]